MILGVGIDLVEIDRIKRAIERYNRKFLDRIYTLREQAYCEQFASKWANYAARFAAKEAVAKALGTGFQKGLSWTDIEIIRSDEGKPEIFLREPYLPCGCRIHLSMSHCRTLATAYALLEKISA